MQSRSFDRAVLVPQLIRQEVLDVSFGSGHEVRPEHPGVPGNEVKLRSPIRQHGVIRNDRARHVTRCHFGIERVTQPDEQTFGDGETLPDAQRERDLERTPDRQDRFDRNFFVAKDVQPEVDKTADAGIFEHEQSTVPELFIKQLLRSFSEPCGRRRVVPTEIERTPIVPVRASALQ